MTDGHTLKGAKHPGAAVRKIALSLPDSAEVLHMGSPSFRVRGKIFAQLSEDGQTALVKLSLAEQDARLRAFPDRFWTPTHWGKFGWTHVRIEGTGAAELRSLLEESWQLVSRKS